MQDRNPRFHITTYVDNMLSTGQQPTSDVDKAAVLSWQNSHRTSSINTRGAMCGKETYVWHALVCRFDCIPSFSRSSSSFSPRTGRLLLYLVYINLPGRYDNFSAEIDSNATGLVLAEKAHAHSDKQEAGLRIQPPPRRHRGHRQQFAASISILVDRRTCIQTISEPTDNS